MSLNLHLGCGDIHLEGWVNVDADPECAPDVVADVHELPYEDETCDVVLAIHLLEHFAFDDPVLSEWHRVLRPGGRIIVVVPDLIATYVMRNRAGVGWGRAHEHPLDLRYLNGVVYGGPALGGEWDRPGMAHRQIFIFDMLAERLRELFPDAREVPRVGELVAQLGECMVTGTKALPDLLPR